MSKILRVFFQVYVKTFATFRQFEKKKKCEQKKMR